VRNQCCRSAEDPCVQVSGLTRPWNSCWRRSSPTAAAASIASATSRSEIEVMNPVCTACAAHTPAQQSAWSSSRTERSADPGCRAGRDRTSPASPARGARTRARGRTPARAVLPGRRSGRELTEEAQVDVDPCVRRAVEGADVGCHGAASGRRPAGEQHRLGRCVLRDRPLPIALDAVDVGHDRAIRLLPHVRTPFGKPKGPTAPRPTPVRRHLRSSLRRRSRGSG
jgi:hypothetical protein